MIVPMIVTPSDPKAGDHQLASSATGSCCGLAAHLNSRESALQCDSTMPSADSAAGLRAAAIFFGHRSARSYGSGLFGGERRRALRCQPQRILTIRLLTDAGSLRLRSRRVGARLVAHDHYY